VVVRNTALIQYYTRSPHGPVGRMLQQKGLRVQNTGRVLAPVDRGGLRSSITTTDPYPTPRGQGIAIGSNLVYSLAVHDGSGSRYAPPSWRAAHAAGRPVPARPYLRNALPAGLG
jgi:hypothetical protein